MIGKYGAEDSEKLIDAIRARDDSAITAYIEANPNSGELLVAGLLFVSHDTPYSHPIPPVTAELIKKHTTPSSLIGTIMSFWTERPSTGTVLVMKYVDLDVITLSDVVSWLLDQDSWMRKSWGWEIVQTCFEKAEGRRQTAIEQNGKPTEEPKERKPSDEMDVDKPAEDVMHVDSKNGEMNGSTTNERREMFEKIVGGVEACYERQGERDQYWLKEWFAMVVRKYGTDLDGLERTGWAGQFLSEAEGHQQRQG
jgi:hypothetical protein